MRIFALTCKNGLHLPRIVKVNFAGLTRLQLSLQRKTYSAYSARLLQFQY